jgi:hypothetical protein
MIGELTLLSNVRFIAAFCFALAYAGLEDKDQTFTWLERACDERFIRLAYLNIEEFWDPIRSDPRFAKLVRRVGIPPQARLTPSKSCGFNRTKFTPVS